MGALGSRVLFTLLLGMLTCACGEDSTSPSSTTTTFQGTLAGSGGQSGTLTVTVQAQVASATPSFFRFPLFATLHAQGTTVTATGSLRLIGGSTASVSGTYDSSSRALSVSGGGFTITGTATGGVINGTYTGPSGAAGAFSSRSTATGAVSVYCGNIFSSGNPNDMTGVFNLLVSDSTGAVSGAFYLIFSPFNNGEIAGQLNGSSLSITYTDRVSGQSGNATGTIQGGSVSGSSPASSGGTNPFSGSTSRCQS